MRFDVSPLKILTGFKKKVTGALRSAAASLLEYLLVQKYNHKKRALC